MYLFDRFTVDPLHRRLLLTEAAQAVDLPPRAFDLLLMMVERPGELLAKKDLMRALWPNVVVEENSLNQVVSTLRRVLGEKPAEHRFIVTAPGRGYRFVAAVRRVEGAADEGAADDLSLAVLPFTPGGVTPGDEYLGDALAADLIRNLSRRAHLRVAAQGSSFAFRNTGMAAADIARQLNVRRIVEGQLSQQGDELTVTARLLEGAGGAPLWSTTLQRPLSDVVALQADLARQVASAMDSTQAPVVPPVAVAPEIYLDYLRALSYSQRPSATGIRDSIQLLQSALARSPGFARARSLLAIQCTSAVMFGLPVENALDLARREVATALELDDQDGETHLAAAVLDCLGGAWSRAEERFRLAHSLTGDPLVSGLRSSYLTSSTGQLQRALQQAEHTLRAAPTHPLGVQILAMIHSALGNHDASRRYAELAIDLGQSPSVAPLADVLAHLSLRQGDPGDIAARLSASLPERLQATEGGGVIEALIQHLRAPDVDATARALQALQRALTPAELDPPMRKRLIFWYTLAGATDHAYALAWNSLEHYAREGTIGGAWGMLWLPEMRAFRDDPRFQPFARALRLFDYWNEYGPPDGYALAADRLVPGH